MKPYDRLLEHNIKPSMQRIAIMEYLMEHPIHPSADDIYTALSPSMPTLSKTTVYNTLKLFSEQGAALMLTIDEKNTNFEAKLLSSLICKRKALPRDSSQQNSNMSNLAKSLMQKNDSISSSIVPWQQISSNNSAIKYTSDLS